MSGFHENVLLMYTKTCSLILNWQTVTQGKLTKINANSFMASSVYYCSVTSKPLQICKSRATLSLHPYAIQGGPEKNGTGYFPQNVYAITGINLRSNFTWEIWYKITNFGSVFFLLFLEHISWSNVEAPPKKKKKIPFQLKLGLHKCHFGSP